MKNKRIKLSVENMSYGNHISVPEGRFESSWFKCQKCGHTVQMLVRGDTATCSKCGGMMRRC